jgi:type VI secretion system protein ImpC
MADFEPDSIYWKSELFAAFREGRAEPLYSEMEESESAAPLRPTNEQIERLTSPGGLLDSIAEKSDEFQSMVERIVAPYALPAETVESRRAAAERAQRLNLLMSHILHDDRFQALEAAWRGLDLLARGLDTDGLVRIYILDCSKEKLDVHLKNAAGFAERFGLIIGNFSFDRASLFDVELLARIGLATQSLGAPFVAERLPSQHDDSKAQAAWEVLRRAAAATYIGLALPRFLLRLPYGKDTVPVEAFDFEEIPGDAAHSDYLWGNPSFACALVLGQLWEQQCSLSPIPANIRLSGMPQHVFMSEGEPVARPCTEVLLTDRDCETLLSDGVLPLVAVKGTDAIVFPQMQSIADPSSALAGFQSINW